MSFLPTGYKEVEDYMSFAPGANKLRILSSAIVGWEYWNDEDGKRKVYRKRLEDDLIMSEIQEPEKVKKFWAFVVWNYRDEAIQILEITQKGIRKDITAYINNKKFGSPVDKYDLTITREGTGMLTKYAVQADPPDTTDKKITEALKAKYVNLDMLFSGGNPFIKESMNEDVDPKTVKI